MYKCNKIKQIVCFFMIVWLCFSLPVYSAETRRIEDFLFDLGKKFYDEGDYPAALHQFDKVLFLDPNHQETIKYVNMIKGIKEPPLEGSLTIESEASPAKKESIVEDKSVKKPYQEEKITIEGEVSRPIKQYVIGEEDVVDVAVWEIYGKEEKEKDKKEEKLKKEKAEEVYRITKGDVLDISVWRWPDLAKNVIVRPDGMISFPLVGDIDAEGLSLTELDDLITKKLTEFIKSPEVSVMIRAFGSPKQQAAMQEKKPFVKVNELSGQMQVRPDGMISVPLVGDVMAAGNTPDELSGLIKEKVEKYVDNPVVNVSMSSFGGKKIVILGEVGSPGVYRPPGAVSAVEAIALAGGYTNDAVLQSVLLVRGDLSNPVTKRLDLNKAIKKGDLADNVIIEPRDIVYVPKTFIADVNYFLGQILEPLTSSSTAVDAIKIIRTGVSPKK